MNRDDHHRVSILTLHCCEASRLLSESQDRALSWQERWALRIHTVLCGACRRFGVHLRFLRDVTTQLPAELRGELLAGTVQLSPARRAEIKRLLKAAAAES